MHIDNRGDITRAAHGREYDGERAEAALAPVPQQQTARSPLNRLFAEVFSGACNIASSSARALRQWVEPQAAPRLSLPISAHGYRILMEDVPAYGTSGLSEPFSALQAGVFADYIRHGPLAEPGMVTLARHAQSVIETQPGNPILTRRSFIMRPPCVLDEAAVSIAAKAFENRFLTASFAAGDPLPAEVDAHLRALQLPPQAPPWTPSMSPDRPTLLSCLTLQTIWDVAFDPCDTQPGDFTLTDGTTMSMPMMRQPDALVAVSEGVPGFEWVVVKPLHTDWRGHGVHMLYALPERPATRWLSDPTDDVRELLRRLSEGASLKESLDLEAREVDFRVPRFSLALEQTVEAYIGLPLRHGADDTAAPTSTATQLVHVVHAEGNAGLARIPEDDAPHEPPVIAIDAPFYAMLLSADNFPIVMMHIADPRNMAGSVSDDGTLPLHASARATPRQ